VEARTRERLGQIVVAIGVVALNDLLVQDFKAFDERLARGKVHLWGGGFEQVSSAHNRFPPVFV
jgi:hypothetical protein